MLAGGGEGGAHRRLTLRTVLSHALFFAVGLVFHRHVLLPIRQLGETTEPVSCQTAAPFRTQNDDGWHSIEVFYGDTEFFLQQRVERQRFKKSPSPDDFVAQLQQDRIVSRLFRNRTHGYFVDLAANHAVWISNTYALERQFHWTGLCIEPNPEYWSDLAHRDCQVVAAVVGNATRRTPVLFQSALFNSPAGGIVGDEYDNHYAGGAVMKYTVPLYEILRRFQAPPDIDYLSLDVEGAESLVLMHFPFHDYRFKVLSIERPKEDLQALLQAQGYELLGLLGSFGETMWVRADVKDSLDLASVQAFFE